MDVTHLSINSFLLKLIFLIYAHLHITVQWMALATVRSPSPFYTPMYFAFVTQGKVPHEEDDGYHDNEA